MRWSFAPLRIASMGSARWDSSSDTWRVSPTAGDWRFTGALKGKLKGGQAMALFEMRCPVDACLADRRVALSSWLFSWLLLVDRCLQGVV